METEEWVTLREAQTRLGIAYDTIRQRVRDNHIPHRYGSDRQLRIPWSSIRQFPRKRNVNGRPAKHLDAQLATQFSQLRQSLRALEKAVRDGQHGLIEETSTTLLAQAERLVGTWEHD